MKDTRIEMTMDISFEASDPASAVGIIKACYDEGKKDACTAVSWKDAYNAGFSAALTAFQQLAMPLFIENAGILI